MSVKQVTICTCDICGAQMDCGESGHMHYANSLTIGFNNKNDENCENAHYEDVCADCIQKINNTIAQLQDSRRNKDSGDCFAVFENKDIFGHK